MYITAALVADASAVVATSALAAFTPARAALTRCRATGSYTLCDASPRRSQILTGPMIWPAGSSSGFSPAGAGKLKPNVALLIVWLVQFGTRSTCGNSAERDCVT